MLYGRFNFPEGLQRALRFVPPAVFTAIFLPELFWPNGDIDLGLGNERLLAGLLAIIVAWRTKNVIITIVVGMIALWILQVLIN
jgi:branched-subunit amino acid transport protein